MFLKDDLPKATADRIKAMCELRDCVRKLIDLQVFEHTDEEIRDQQLKLNTMYDRFADKYGLINSSANAKAFSEDNSYYLLSSLEVINENGELERKADMFTKRTIKQKHKIERVDTAAEALAVSIAEKAGVDIGFMSKLSGKTEEQLASDLKGVIFLNPLYEMSYSASEPKYVTADEYLSGNIREKLGIAQLMAVTQPENYGFNVEKLTEAIEAIRSAYQHGCTFFDTAEVYSPNLSGIGHNELIVGKALEDVRDDVVIATKLMLHSVGFGRKVYDEIRRHLEGSLDRLRTDYVDIYYLHRMGGVSVEKVAEAMGRLIDDGLIRGWRLSQVDVDVIDAAQSVTPLTAIQNIYSMVERDSEESIIPYCMEHNIGFVPFSPIASGLLSGKITLKTQFERNDDVRNWVPQLSRRNIEGNMPIVEMLRAFADRKNAAPAQISLAWMLHKYPNVVPIPGSKNKERIIENLDSSEVSLTDAEFEQLESELNKCKVYGHRGLGGF